MNIATVLRYCDLNQNSIWDHRYYILRDYQLMAEKYQFGLTAVMTPYDLERACENCDGLIVTGSATNIDPSYYGMPPLEKPEPVDEYALDAKLMELFLRAGKPIFGVCGGLQALNVFFGGTLKRLDDPEHHADKSTNTHPITIKEGSFVHRVFGSGQAVVNSHHGWEIGVLASGLDAVARTADGVIEAVENKEKRVFATQWHPEQSFHTGDPIENLFFQHFLQCCKER